MQCDPATEWLEADGLGGFASGTVGLARTRRYHALLLTATTPPTGRMVLVNGFDASVETVAGTAAITTQHYAPGVQHPDGATRITDFTSEPWPTWEFALPDGSRLRQELLVQHGTGIVLLQWTVLERRGPLTLVVRPFVSGRDYHALMRENGAFGFDLEQAGASSRIRMYPDVPAVTFLGNGAVEPTREWYRQFLYREEVERGLDAVEDLASPGIWRFSVDEHRPAVWLLNASPDGPLECRTAADAEAEARAVVLGEQQRRSLFASPLHRAADAYLVRRGTGRSILAGYPWFTDWGRDTFVALRGLCLATGRLDEARSILVEWAGAVSEGMLPNRFADGGEVPEYNSVDASLWYVVAVAELLERAGDSPAIASAFDRRRLHDAILAIVEGYASGTRFGIRMDDDGLLAAGVPGVQLTWMDARVGNQVITPRIGKPVEIQALWINALSAAAQVDRRWQPIVTRAMRTFGDRFWNERDGSLYDVVDVDHVRGTVDPTCRPNQILAVGGLPVAVVTGRRARQVVDAVESRLVTPLGLRSLAPGDPAYAAHYQGDGAARDRVYHQGTVWPWLMGPFVEAWLRVRPRTAAARLAARERFILPLRAHLAQAGLGHVSEIADAEAPFTPRGCPFQAWSVGELLRLELQVFAPRSARSRRPLAASVA